MKLLTPEEEEQIESRKRETDERRARIDLHSSRLLKLTILSSMILAGVYYLTSG